MKGSKAGTEIFTILFAFGEKYEKFNGLGFVSLFACLFVDKQTSFQNKQRVKGMQTLHGSNATQAPTLKGPANEMDFFIFIDAIRFGTGSLHNYLNLFNFDFEFAEIFVIEDPLPTINDVGSHMVCDLGGVKS
jgi:hypothetical protein